MKQFILCVVVVVFGIGQARAEIIIDSSTTIDYLVEDKLRIVAGANPPTVVEVVSPAEIVDWARIYDSSILTVSGGETSIIGAFDVSTVNLSGGKSGNISAFDSSSVSVSGGETVSIVAAGSGLVSVSGGSVHSVSPMLLGAVSVSGGSIDILHPSDSSTIRIYGTGFNYGYGEITDRGGQLVGTLKNGDPIDASFGIADDASIILVVPEPSTPPLLATAVAALLALSFTRRRRR